MKFRSGVVVVAAPPRGGKTTTLYTLLDQLNHTNLSIATVEEKIEHRFPHIAQTQTKPEVGLTPVAGLRGVLKQDPDVVMVDDVSDVETLNLALHAASVGALVFVGMEAATAGGAIEKLLRSGISPLLLTSTLRGVIATNTVQRLCTHDKEEYALARAEGAPLEGYADFGKVLAALKDEKVLDADTQWKEVLFARAIACPHCEDGYEGILGVQEVLPINATTKEMIVAGANAGEFEEQARKEGMLTLIEDALMKAAQSLTSAEEVFELVENFR